MSGMNPIIMIQLLLQYHNYKDDGNRVFKFVKNHRMRVHSETNEEMSHRKSLLAPEYRGWAKNAVRSALSRTLNGKLGTVYIDQKMSKMAVPLQMSTGSNGYGAMPSGSRMDIPEGRFVRAFTYWEKVNDIDLSCFALTEDGQQREFSWRNMYKNQGTDICFSGDETSGFEGGSEYFDIDIDLFRKNHPEFRYLVFCDNIYSGVENVRFDDYNVTAGFMIREKMEPGTRGYYRSQYYTNTLQPKVDIFEPKTVKTSFKLKSNSRFAYIFAIDMKTRQMIWLDIAREGNYSVAGTTKMNWLLDYMTITDVYNLHDLFNDLATTVTTDPAIADVIISDENFINIEKPIIHSWDTEKIFQYLNAG